MRSPAGGATEVERVREKFLSVGSLDAVRSVDEDILRPSVLDSWRRSQVLRVHPDRVELPYVREPNRGSRLARAAAPVLQRVADDLAAHTVGVLLTSTDGVVVERTAPEVSVLNALDTTSIAPGYSLAEEAAGTNGIGTALETGRPAFIRGGEHYVAMWFGFACAGSPIRDPITRRIIGVVNLSCLAVESDPLLLALATSAAHQIEDRMRVVAHEGETALLEAYLQQARRSSSGVLAIGGDVVLMNPYLRRTLDGNDQTALLEHASDLLTSTLSGTALAVLPSGHIAKITAADRSTMRGGRTNVVFHVDLSAETSSHPSSNRPLGAHSHPWPGRSQQRLAALLPAGAAVLPRPRLGDARGRERIRSGTAGPGGGAVRETGPNRSGDARRDVSQRGASRRRAGGRVRR